MIIVMRLVRALSLAVTLAVAGSISFADCGDPIEISPLRVAWTQGNIGVCLDGFNPLDDSSGVPYRVKYESVVENFRNGASVWSLTETQSEGEVCKVYEYDSRPEHNYSSNIGTHTDLDDRAGTSVAVTTRSGYSLTDFFRSSDYWCLAQYEDHWAVHDYFTTPWPPAGTLWPLEFVWVPSGTVESVPVSDISPTESRFGTRVSFDVSDGSGEDGDWDEETNSTHYWTNRYYGLHEWLTVTKLSRPDTIEDAIERANAPADSGLSSWSDAEWYASCEEAEENCISGGWKSCTVVFAAICPGDYLLEVPILERPYDQPNAQPSATVLEIPVTISQKDADSGEFRVKMPIKPCAKRWPDLRADNGRVKPIMLTPRPMAEPGAAACGFPKANSLHMAWGLGNTDQGRSAGLISIVAEELTPASIGLASFRIRSFDTDSPLQIEDHSPTERIVEGDNVDVILTKLPTGSVRLEFYRKGPGVTPLQSLRHVWTVGPVSPDNYAQVVVKHMIGGNGEEFVFSNSGNQWGLDKAGDSYESLTYEPLVPGEPADTEKEVRRYRKSASSPDEYVVQRIYRAGPFGRLLVKETEGYGTSYAQVTDWNYDLGTGRLLSRSSSDGSWERYSYYSDGRIQTKTLPWGNSLITTLPGKSHKVIEYTYDNQCAIDGAAASYDTEVEKVHGHEVRREITLRWTNRVEATLDRFGSYWTNQVWRIRAPAGWVPAETLTAASLLGSAELRLSRSNYTAGSGNLLRFISEAGVMTLNIQYPKTTISVTGAPATDLESVEEGTITESFYNNSGDVISEETWTVEAGSPKWCIASKRATAFEQDDRDNGRPLKFVFQDGTSESNVYACCGRISETVDKDGVRSSFTYYPSGAQKDETVEGVTRRSYYDAFGHLVKRARLATPQEVVEYEAKYDLAGRLEWEKNATDVLKGVRTDYAYSLTSGALTRTSTHTGSLASVVEVFYRDGRLAKRTGSGAFPVAFDYLIGALPDGAQWSPPITTPVLISRETKLSATGARTAEWVASYYDRFGELVKTVYSDGAAASRFFNSKGQLVRERDPDGVQNLYDYNPKGDRTLAVLDYDRDGVIDFDGTDRIRRTTLTYGTEWTGGLASISTVEEWGADDEDSAVEVAVTARDVDGKSFMLKVNEDVSFGEIQYNPATRIRTESTTNPDSTLTVREFEAGLLKRVTRISGDFWEPEVISEVAYRYNAQRQLEAVSTLHAPGAAVPESGQITSYTYYSDGKVHTITTPDPDTTKSGDGADARVIVHEYDSAGRLWKKSETGLEMQVLTYWPNGLVRAKSGGAEYPVEYTYDAQGRLKTQVTWKDRSSSAGAATTTWNYHPNRGWLTSKTYDGGVAGPSYTYLNSGRLWTRSWARGITTTYEYNAAGDLWQILYPASSAPNVTILYDRRGRVRSVSDAAGTVTKSYTNGILDLESYSDGLLGGLSIDREFEPMGDGYTSWGNRPAGYTATGLPQVDIQYDQAGRLWEVSAVGGPSSLLGYDPAHGGVSSIVTSSAGVERLRGTARRDDLGRVTDFDWSPGVGTDLLRGYSYDDAGRRTRVSQESSRYWSYGYDDLGQVESAEKRIDDGDGNWTNDSIIPGFEFGFEYDDIGNRKVQNVNGRSSEYSTDSLNRYQAKGTPLYLDVRGRAAMDAGVLVNDELAIRTGEDFYAAVPVRGFRENLLRIQAAKPAQSKDYLVTEDRWSLVPAVPESFSYDADGNLLRDGLWKYEWDGENRLSAVELQEEVLTTSWKRIEYAYDYMGRRVKKTVKTRPASGPWTVSSDTRYLYDGWNLVGEYDGLASLAPIRAHVWGLDVSGSAQGAGGVGALLWATDLVAGKTYAAGADANGNVIVYADCSDGAVVGRREYGPFGESLVTSGAARNLPFGFSTKYEEKELGLYYYGFRYYNPSTGRWLSRDPIGEGDGPAVYAILGNNPVDKVDWLGLLQVMKFSVKDLGPRLVPMPRDKDTTLRTYFACRQVEFLLRICGSTSDVRILQYMSIFRTQKGVPQVIVKADRSRHGSVVDGLDGVMWDGVSWRSGWNYEDSTMSGYKSPRWMSRNARIHSAVFYDSPGFYPSVQEGGKIFDFPVSQTAKFRTEVRRASDNRLLAKVEWSGDFYFSSP